MKKEDIQKLENIISAIDLKCAEIEQIRDDIMIIDNGTLLEIEHIGNSIVSLKNCKARLLEALKLCKLRYAQ